MKLLLQFFWKIWLLFSGNNFGSLSSSSKCLNCFSKRIAWQYIRLQYFRYWECLRFTKKKKSKIIFDWVPTFKAQLGFLSLKRKVECEYCPTCFFWLRSGYSFHRIAKRRKSFFVKKIQLVQKFTSPKQNINKLFYPHLTSTVPPSGFLLPFLRQWLKVSLFLIWSKKWGFALAFKCWQMCFGLILFDQVNPLGFFWLVMDGEEKNSVFLDM